MCRTSVCRSFGPRPIGVIAFRGRLATATHVTGPPGRRNDGGGGACGRSDGRSAYLRKSCPVRIAGKGTGTTLAKKGRQGGIFGPWGRFWTSKSISTWRGYENLLKFTVWVSGPQATPDDARPR